MTRQTDSMTTTDGATIVAAPPRDWALRLAVAAIVALTLTLVGWAGTQAVALEASLDERMAHPYPSIRQAERAAQTGTDLEELDAAETHRFENRARAATDTTSGRPSALDLARMEYTELRRFRNRAPADALPALDAEIDRLRAVIDAAD